MSQQSSFTVKNEDNLPGDADKCHQIGSPYVKSISAHIQEIRHAGPDHRVAPCSSPTHTVWRSRSRIMVRVRINTTAMAYIQHAIDMISMPVSMVLAILGDWVTLTVAP